MAKRRGAGVGEAEAVEETAAGKAPRTAAGCRTYMRGELTKGFPKIVEGFVKAAKTGSVPHVKLATELLRSGQAKKARRPASVTDLMKRMAE